MNSISKLIVILFCLYYVESAEIIKSKSAKNVNLLQTFDATGAKEEQLPKRLLIYPGTKWCGLGNVSEHDEDYGAHKDTDKCCKTHDLCPDFIKGYQTKYYLQNPSFYTRLSCDCDQEFYDCLKKVNTRVSGRIGYIYFNLLKTKCFKKEYPIEGCKKYTKYPWKKCVAHHLNTAEEKIYQWFDVPNF